jgi:hypothetical protein
MAVRAAASNFIFISRSPLFFVGRSPYFISNCAKEYKYQATLKITNKIKWIGDFKGKHQKNDVKQFDMSFINAV